jgi:hypothetical protein
MAPTEAGQTYAGSVRIGDRIAGTADRVEATEPVGPVSGQTIVDVLMGRGDAA